MKSWHNVCAAWGKGISDIETVQTSSSWQSCIKQCWLCLFQHNKAVRYWPSGGAVAGSLCIDRTTAFLVSSQNVNGFCYPFCIQAFAITHGVLQLRSELLNKARSILPMLTATKQNSLWIFLWKIYCCFSLFQNVLQSFSSTQKTQKRSLYSTCGNAVAFLLNRCICWQPWGWRGSVHIWLYEYTLNKTVTVILDVELWANPLLRYELLCKKTFRVTTVSLGTLATFILFFFFPRYATDCGKMREKKPLKSPFLHIFHEQFSACKNTLLPEVGCWRGWLKLSNCYPRNLRLSFY